MKTSNAEQAKQTGGMVALIPSDEYLPLLSIPGGEAPQELHTTLLYFGEEVQPDVPSELVDICSYIARSLPQGVTANAFGHALFNPSGETPCAVYLVGNDPNLTDCYNELRHCLERVGLETPEQHTPWIPHITAGYGLPIDALAYTGEVVFDRISIHWYGEVYDFFFGDEPVQGLDDLSGIGLML